jgi:hypothetical protein
MTTPPIGATVRILASSFGREGQTATVVPATVYMRHFPVCVRFADQTTSYYSPIALQVIEIPEASHG